MSSYPPVPPPVILPPQPVDEKVKARALKRLQMLVKGNGIKPEDVTIAESDAKVLIFPAQGMVRLITAYTTRTEAGRVNKGEIIHSAAAFETALTNMVHDIKKDGSKRQIVIDAVTSRADKGFGAKDQTIALETLSRDFSSQEGCGNCARAGKVTCNSCSGKKHVSCNNCHGRLNIMCPQCRGAGNIRNANSSNPGQTTTCPRCRGAARVKCPTCQGRGNLPCKACQATGELRCGKCSGTGWLSHLAHVTLKGHLHFNFERQGMPVELSKLVDAFGARHAAKKDLDIRVLNYDETQAENNDVLNIDYECRVPYGSMTFSLKGKPIQAMLFGWRGTLLKAPDFLDDLTQKGQKHLELASAGRGDVGEELRASARYRVLRDVIILAAASSNSSSDRRIAISKLLTKYPVGLSSDKMLQLLMQASHAVSIITRKPRLTGLALGLIIFTGAEFLYFSNLVRPQIPPGLSQIIVDASQVFLGTALGWAGSFFMARQTLETSLKGLASPGTIKRSLPKFDKLIWVSFALALMITAAFYMLGS